MGREIYPCEIWFEGERAFVAYISDERDGFVRDTAGRLLSVADLDSLARVLGDARIELGKGKPSLYDFDPIRAWCDDPRTVRIDCPAFSNAWNFFDDLTGFYLLADTGYTRASRAANDCHGKLFWGCNLPAVTPSGERFDPIWSVEQVDAIRGVLGLGLLALREELDAMVDRI